MFQVQRRMCATCIYRSESPLDLERLEADVRDPQMPGYFTGYRACHHTAPGSDVCCRGFWDRHKDDFTLGQLAQRLEFVEFVHVDILPRKEKPLDGRAP